ncbi:MAG: hypothetical protein EXS25_12345 [Pedosphaera sp.]|nr:hypothetical protein [Pedosphaera sp.]
MASNTPAYPNFKAAYCAYYECSEDHFVAHALVQSVPWIFRPLATLIYRLNPELFASEIDILQQMGVARSSRHVARAISELSGLRRVERSFWKSIGFRANGQRLTTLWVHVKNHVDRVPETEGRLGTIVPTGLALNPRRLVVDPEGKPSSTPRFGRRETPAKELQRVLRMHRGITEGQPLTEVLEDAQLTETEFFDLLSRHTNGNPALTWLSEQLLCNQENEVLKAKLKALEDSLCAKNTSPPPSA